jgi:hypothetical protein
MYIYNFFLLTMTDTMTSPNTDLSSLNIMHKTCRFVIIFARVHHWLIVLSTIIPVHVSGPVIGSRLAMSRPN